MKKIIFSLILSIVSLFTFGQVVQIGSGTTTNSITTASPVNTYYRRQVCQFVYTATEINTSGNIGVNTLSQLGFYVTNQPLYAIPGYTIKMKLTTQTNVSTSLGTTGWTTVKNAFNYSPNPGGYDMIILDVPFAWDGVQNIGIEICWSQIQPTWDASGQCRIYNSTNGYRYTRNDNAGSICGTSPTTQSNNKPQAQLIFKTVSTWNGSVNTNWFNASNWDAGVPDSKVNVIIPATAVNMPVISNVGAVCKNLTIDAATTLTLSGTNNIDIYSDWTNNGTFVANNGNVTLKGDALNNINGAINQDLYDLTIDNVNGAAIVSGSINLHGTLNIGIATGNFSTNNALTIISDVNGTGRIGQLTTKCIYTLNMSDSYGDGWNGGFITVLINGVAIGDYFALGSNYISKFIAPVGSNVQLNYTSGSYENENTYTLFDGSGAPIFSDGTTPTVGVNVFNTTTACAFFNPITGNITMQRYIDAGATDWRFLTAATSGATIGDWVDDFIMSGFTGTQFPLWPTAANPWSSVYFYDETVLGIQDSGFVAATNITNPLAVGQGVWVYSGDTSIGTQPFTIDVTGHPNVGDINLPITFTNSGLPTDDGWNMVGNPYPSTLDWDSPSISKTGINNAIFIWNPDLQQFASYVAGLGTNGGSKNIASSQAFWIQATSTAANVTVTEASKTVVDGAFLKQTTNINPFKIKAQNNYGIDELIINFNNNASNTFDANYDAQKMISVNTNLPSLSSVMNNTDFSINQLPEQEINIPIKLLSGVNGLQTISVENVNAFTNSSCLILEDLFTGISYDLENTTSFTSYIYDTTTVARFLLHIGAPVNITVTDVSSFGNNDGEIVYTKNSNSSFDIIWKNNLNTIIQANSSIFIADSLKNLTEGTYYIETTDLLCGNSIDTLIVNEPLSVITSIQNNNNNNNNIWINNNILNINMVDMKVIYIQNILGEILFTEQVNNDTDEEVVNLSKFSSQILIISIQTKSGFNSNKISFIRK